MSSGNVEYMEQPDGALLATQRQVSRNGVAVRDCFNAHIPETASDPIPEGKSEKQRVAPSEYVRQDKSKKQQVFMYVIFYVCAI